MSLHDNYAVSLILLLLLLLLFLTTLTTFLLLLLFCFPGHSFRSVPWKGDSRSRLRQIASYYRRMFAEERLPGIAFILSGLNIFTAAGLAQSVERLTAEREVAGSIPGAGPILRVFK